MVVSSHVLLENITLQGEQSLGAVGKAHDRHRDIFGPTIRLRWKDDATICTHKVPEMTWIFICSDRRVSVILTPSLS